MIKLLILLLCVLLTGCVAEHPPTADTTQLKTPRQTEEAFTDNESIAYESCENVYILNQLKRRKNSYMTYMYVQNERICINNHLQTKPIKEVSDLYDLTGKAIGQEDNLPWFYEGETALFLTREASYYDNYTIYQLKDSAGTVVYASQKMDTNGVNTLYYINAYFLGIYIFDGSKNLYFFDNQLSQTVCVTLPHYVKNVTEYSDHEALIQCINNQTYLFNMQTKQVEEITLYSETEVSRKATDILIRTDGTYFILQDGIYVQQEGVDTLLCDFSRSYLSAFELEFCDVLPNDRFLVTFTDAFTGERAPAILAPTDETQRPVRKKLRVASIGSDPDANDGDHQNIINSIAYFNRNNDEYQMELTDYDTLAEYNADGTQYLPVSQIDKHAVELFERDLLDGVAYDVFLFGRNFEGFDDLASKGIFADLSKIANRVNMIACVEDALTEKDKITAIPFSVSLSTLLTTTDTLAVGEALTYDKLFSTRDGLKEGEALFGQYTQREMTDIALTDFVDFENKTCSYDSAAFVNVLSFLSEYETSVFGNGGGLLNRIVTPTLNNTYGVLNTGAGMISMSGDLLTPFANGTVKFLQWDISSPESIPMFYYLEETLGKELNICGYPTQDGGSIHMGLGMRMAIREDGEHTDGAERYVSMMLSEAVQTKVAKAAFPVVRSAVENTVDWGWQFFFTDSYVSDYLSRWDTTFHISYGGSSYLPADGTYLFSHEIQVLKSKHESMLAYVCDSSMRTTGDQTIRAIIDEELSAAANGVRSVAEAAKIIQSRVDIYINE